MKGKDRVVLFRSIIPSVSSFLYDAATAADVVSLNTCFQYNNVC